MKLRLGTRRSALAQAQATWVAERLRSIHKNLSIELVFITTSGDRSQTSPASATATTNLKAMFTKEIEEALLQNEIDLAVHSLKDMAADMPAGLCIAAVPEREDPRDVWISRLNEPFEQASGRLTVGTSAIRRQLQLQLLKPTLTIASMRGNVETRLRKLDEGQFDAIVLALAGLRRLGLDARATTVLPVDQFLPAVGQGCLGIQAREKDSATLSLVDPLNHPASRAAADAERGFLQAMGASCQTPIAAYAQVDGNSIVMNGLEIHPQTMKKNQACMTGNITEAADLGRRLAKAVRDAS